MDRDQVDAWVSGVDELLAGRRDDESVSGDAMRWSPDVPEAGPVLPDALWDACMRPAFTVVESGEALRALMADWRVPRYVDDYRIPHDLGRQFGLTMQQARAACQRMSEVVSETVAMLGHAYVRVPLSDEPVEVDDVGNRIRRRALEARRNRDTGPPRPPLGRRVR